MTTLVWAEIRRRWLGAALVGLVLGVGFAAVLAAAVGARRTQTAFPRMLAATASAEVLVSSATPDQRVRRQVYEQIGALEGVERAGLIAGLNLIPIEVPRGAGTTVEACANGPLDGVFGYAVDRPNLLEGRMPDPRHRGEIAITHDYAETFGVGLGDELDLVVSGVEGLKAGEVTADDGPVVHATIVGIGVIASQVVPISDLDRAPRILPSPAMAEPYADDQERYCYDGIAVRLTPGTGVPGFVDEITRLAEPTGGLFVQDRTASFDEVRRSIQPQVTALWLFAAAAAAATVLVVVQVLGRQLQQTADASTPVWRALGMSRGQTRTLVAAPSLVTALVGSVVAVVLAVVLSGRFPIGPARLAETDRGLELHAWLHGGGALAVLTGALAIGAVVGVLSTQVRARPARVGRLARAGRSLSQPAVVVGVHLTSGAGRGKAAVPTRSAAAGVALALAAVFASVTVARALGDLVSVPARYGKDWDVMVDGVFAPAPVATVLDRLGRHEAVSAIAGGRYGEVSIDGQQVPTVGLTDLVGTTFPAVIDGRAPSRDDEIVVGRRSLRDLGRSIGETVSVDTGTGPRDMTVVGTAAFPRLNHGSFSAMGLGVGAMARSAAFPPFDIDFSEAPPGFDVAAFVGPGGDLFEFVTIRTNPAAPADARRDVVSVSAEIATRYAETVRFEQRPTAIDNYAAVRSVPVVLAALLGSMAAVTLGHLVVSVVRRRRRDLALCAALGMRQSQILGAVVIQALLVAGAALVLGLPLGLAAGRVAWSGFASELGVIDTLRLPVGAILLAVGVVGVGAALIAAVPATLAARRSPAEVLRSE